MTNFKLTAPQTRLMKELLLNDGCLCRPWGYRTAGRDAANWDRMVPALEAAGLVLCDRRYSGGLVHRMRPALPLPAEFSR